MSSDDLATRLTELERRLWWQALRTSQLQAAYELEAAKAASAVSEEHERLARELAAAIRDRDELRANLAGMERSRFWRLKLALQPYTRVVRRVLGRSRG